MRGHSEKLFLKNIPALVRYIACTNARFLRCVGVPIEPPKVGSMVGVRAEGGGFWIARVDGFNGKEEVVHITLILFGVPHTILTIPQDVQWLDEIKSHENYFVLLDWFDTISIFAIIKTGVQMDNMKSIFFYAYSVEFV